MGLHWGSPSWDGCLQETGPCFSLQANVAYGTSLAGAVDDSDVV